jgi:hypothetical protein
MKKLVLVSGAALLLSGIYVWGSKPATHITPMSSLQNSHKTYANDTIPKKDTTKRKDSIQLR